MTNLSIRKSFDNRRSYSKLGANQTFESSNVVMSSVFRITLVENAQIFK